MKTVGIIVLTYNSLEETTKPCVESLYRAKTAVDFELILVDNFSTDGTRDHLQSISGCHDNVRVVLNDRNLGYAAGNNVGITSTDARYYVLLNSDTIVTDYWLDGLVGFLEKHPDVGMVGPVSNSVGNEQMIHVDPVDEATSIAEGGAWTSRCQGDYFYAEMLGFFCVMIKKEVIDAVGMLDESFGLGMFEDDDFCLRARRQGFHLACVEDVFVYHKGSVSFRNAALSNLNELFFSNLRKFEIKHGVQWRTRCAAPPFLQLLSYYLDAHRNDPEKLRFKAANKIKIMSTFQYPSVNIDCDTLKNELESVTHQLHMIKSSLSWKVVSSLTRLIDLVRGRR